MPPIDAIQVWPGLVAICSFVLFVEAALLFRLVFAVRQASWRYVLSGIPLTLSIWCFTVAMHAWRTYEGLFPPMPPAIQPDIHFTPALRNYLINHINMLLQPDVSQCQLAAGIAVGVFALLLYLQSRMFPRDVRAPAWVVAREHLIHR